MNARLVGEKRTDNKVQQIFKKDHVNDKKKLRILYLNTRSVRKKRNIVMKLMQESKANCIIISEHWLSEDEIQVFAIENFTKVAFTTRNNDRIGGGVMILVKSDIICDFECVSGVDDLSMDFVCEITAVRLKFINFECIVVG